MVAVFTCVSSASAFSRVSLIVPLNIVSASAASSHFYSSRRVAPCCRSRAWVRASVDWWAALPFFDADCSESIFCERRWAMTVVCCKPSCIVCKAVVARSSEICSGFCTGETVAEESSHPFQAPLQPFFRRVLPCHGTWLEELLLLAGEKLHTAGHHAFRMDPRQTEERGRAARVSA